MREVDDLLVDHVLASALEQKAQILEHMVDNGTTMAHLSSVLFEDETDDEEETSSQSSNDSVGDDEDELEDDDQFMNAILVGKVDPDIIMAAEENGVKERYWSRTDPTSNRFQTVDKGSPEWKDVTRRRTLCLRTDQVLEDIEITPDMDDEFLHRLLPIGTNGTRTEFYFDVSSLVMATHAEKPCGVTSEHLSKVWRISVDEAAKTIDQSGHE